MRLERLTVEGFGPFAAAQHIDFRPLDDAGLFLITGRTGSGKSSLLDAVCFALYGGAPRYDGGRARLRSDHVGPDAPTRVELEFVVAGERWRVVRSPDYERPKRRGEGTTPQKEQAELARWDGEQWEVVAARAVDVAERLAPVLQLTRSQFLQVILLAQGRFQEFLQARSEDRLALLRTLFGTERFARFEAELAERAKGLEGTVAAAASAIAADLARLAELAAAPAPERADGAWAREVAVALAAEEVRAAAVDGAARARLDVADRAAAAAESTAAAQRRRDGARRRRADLAAAEPEIRALRDRLAGAARAAPVLPHVEAVDRAGDALAASTAAIEVARRSVGAAADPRGEAGELATRLGALEGPLADEGALAGLRADVDDATAAEHAARHDLGLLRARAEALPGRRRHLEQRRSDAEVGAAAGPAAREAVERAERVRAAAARAARLDVEAEEADGSLLAALDAERAAAAAALALVSARIAGSAGALAAALRPGEPCPVCGGTEHPAPAPAAAAVDDGSIDAARVAQDAAVRTREAAADRSAALRTDLAGARAEAGALDEPTAAAALDRAVVALREAEQARADATGVAAELATLEAELAALEQGASAAEERLAALADSVVVAADRLGAAEARVDRARQGERSVAERVEALRGRRDDLLLLALAVEARERAAGEVRAAEGRLATALAASGIADAVAARAAGMTDAEGADAEAAVAAHAAASAACEAVLAEPDVIAAPEAPADVDGTTAAKTAALQHRVDAADRRAAARVRAADAARLARAVEDAEDGIAADRERLAVLAPLAATVRGDGANEKRMRLESYVLAARLEQIVAAANVRLATMTDGRFTLRHDDTVGYRNVRSGLGLEVLDEHTGRPRPIASLSGGETFLASLALALGLAEVVSAEAGGVRLDTLFVDEGFGALDRQTLDTAMATLDSLRAGGRVVGLISHVEAMQEDVPAGLHVERTPEGPSTVRMRAGVSAMG